jgi:hypothetical protein
MDEIVSATANFTFIIPDSIINRSGLIRGDDVIKAIIGPHGSTVVSIDTITAIVPQEHNGVNAPNATLPIIDTFFCLLSDALNFSGSTYTLRIDAITIPSVNGTASFTRVFSTYKIVSLIILIIYIPPLF